MHTQACTRKHANTFIVTDLRERLARIVARRNSSTLGPIDKQLKNQKNYNVPTTTPMNRRRRIIFRLLLLRIFVSHVCNQQAITILHELEGCMVLAVNPTGTTRAPETIQIAPGPPLRKQTTHTQAHAHAHLTQQPRQCTCASSIPFRSVSDVL